MTISRRPEDPVDEPFLRRLVIGTVAAQLGADSWSLPMREHLLNLQYQSRRMRDKTLFPDGSSQIIVADGEDVGWLFLADLAEEIRIVEIMTLDGYRGKGVGSAVIGDVLASAAKPVRLGVNVMNAGAIRLYRRLGFRQTGCDEVQCQMEYLPPPSPTRR